MKLLEQLEAFFFMGATAWLMYEARKLRRSRKQLDALIDELDQEPL